MLFSGSGGRGMSLGTVIYKYIDQIIIQLCKVLDYILSFDASTFHYSQIQNKTSIYLILNKIKCKKETFLVLNASRNKITSVGILQEKCLKQNKKCECPK